MQFLLLAAVTVAEFLTWWQPNNTSAICPWVKLPLNFNSPFKKIDPCCLYARRFTNWVKWLGKDWWHVCNQWKQVRQAICIHLVTYFHLVLLITNPVNSAFSNDTNISAFVAAVPTTNNPIFPKYRVSTLRQFPFDVTFADIFAPYFKVPRAECKQLATYPVKPWTGNYTAHAY